MGHRYRDAANDKHLKDVSAHIEEHGSTEGYVPPEDDGSALPGEGAPPSAEGAEGGDEGQPEDDTPKLPPIELEGAGEQLTLKITGAKPDLGTAKMQGGKIDIPKGEYQPGDVVEAVVRMRCTEVAVIDKMNNSTGEVVERERVHKFKVMGIEKIGK